MIDGGLRPLFRKNLRGIHWQSVETGGTGLGIPDSNYCGDGVEGWVEYKQTDAWAVDLSPEQVGWHLHRARRGGRTFVAVRRWHGGGPRKGDPVDQLWLYDGVACDTLNNQGLTSTSGLRGCWDGGPEAWAWDAVRGILLESLERTLEDWSRGRRR